MNAYGSVRQIKAAKMEGAGHTSHSRLWREWDTQLSSPQRTSQRQVGPTREGWVHAEGMGVEGRPERVVLACEEARERVPVGKQPESPISCSYAKLVPEGFVFLSGVVLGRPSRPWAGRAAGRWLRWAWVWASTLHKRGLIRLSGLVTAELTCRREDRQRQPSGAQVPFPREQKSTFPRWPGNVT